jgi:hypothetical protein
MDEIVANFWDVEIDKNEYACPTTNGLNWFDVLGHAIEDLQYFQTKRLDGSLCYHKACGMDEMYNPMFDFGSIIEQIISNCVCCNTMSDLKFGLKWCKPYFELCYYLKSMDIVGVAMGW